MKRNFYFLLSAFASFILISACRQEKAAPSAPVEPMYACYQSISGTDTAWLQIDTAQKVITGTLVFNYVDKQELFEGDFKGEMRGDTLKGHYNVRVNKTGPQHRNPVAFLKRDGKLTMGAGKFMMVMGTAEFDNLVPIEYDNGRFIFEGVECK